MKKAFEIANVAAVSTTHELRSRRVFPSLRPPSLLFSCTQVCFFGEQYPHFVFIDDIQFVRVSALLCVAVRCCLKCPHPVARSQRFRPEFILVLLNHHSYQPMNVGSLAEFTSTVVYSQQGHIVVQVRKHVQ